MTKYKQICTREPRARIANVSHAVNTWARRRKLQWLWHGDSYERQKFRDVCLRETVESAAFRESRCSLSGHQLCDFVLPQRLNNHRKRFSRCFEDEVANSREYGLLLLLIHVSQSNRLIELPFYELSLVVPHTEAKIQIGAKTRRHSGREHFYKLMRHIQIPLMCEACCFVKIPTFQRSRLRFI